jgi:hypothetical protein
VTDRADHAASHRKEDSHHQGIKASSSSTDSLNRLSCTGYYVRVGTRSFLLTHPEHRTESIRRPMHCFHSPPMSRPSPSSADANLLGVGVVLSFSPGWSLPSSVCSSSDGRKSSAHSSSREMYFVPPPHLHEHWVSVKRSSFLALPQNQTLSIIIAVFSVFLVDFSISAGR